MHLLSFFILWTSWVTTFVQALTTDQSVLRSLDTAPVVHFTISRRNGAFTGTKTGVDWVDLDYLVKQLDITECRFNLTRREVKGNKLIRKAKTGSAGGRVGTKLMGDIALDGSW